MGLSARHGPRHRLLLAVGLDDRRLWTTRPLSCTTSASTGHFHPSTGAPWPTRTRVAGMWAVSTRGRALWPGAALAPWRPERRTARCSLRRAGDVAAATCHSDQGRRLQIPWDCRGLLRSAWGIARAKARTCQVLLSEPLVDARDEERCDKDPKITWTNLAGLGERCVRAARARTSPWRWHRPRRRSETGQGPPTRDLSWSLPKTIIDALSPTRAPRAAGAPVSKRMATSPIMTDRSRQDASHREGSRGLAGSSRHLRDAGPPIRRWAKPDGAMAGVHRAVTARTPQGVKVIPPFACVVVISSTHVRPGARPTLFPAASVKVVVALSLARCQVTGR